MPNWISLVPLLSTGAIQSIGLNLNHALAQSGQKPKNIRKWIVDFVEYFCWVGNFVFKL